MESRKKTKRLIKIMENESKCFDNYFMEKSETKASIIKEYIRTTHNFNNDTRRWEYRGDRGCEKSEAWEFSKRSGGIENPSWHWSFGVHAIKSDIWMSLNWIVDETISMFKGDAACNSKEFEQFVKDNSNYREIIQKDVEDELKFLVEMDMVREKELII